MYIKTIKLKDFRNYNDLSLEFHEKVNIFLGNNAQGKTNLLEAIYLSSLGKSFRTSKDQQMIGFGEEFCRLRLLAEKDDQELLVEFIISQKGKAIKINGVKIKKMAELLEHVYTVIFSPEDLKIVKDEPERRRKFIDRELCQLKPSYYQNLSDYKKVLQQRNAYLKESIIDEAALEIWNLKLCEYGSQIILKRAAFIEKLTIISREIHKNITDGKEKLEISYEASIPPAETISEQQERFFQILKNSQKLDLYNRNTGKGPHKDDLKLLLNGVDIRLYGSQGQQRTAALSLKLAELRLIKEETGEEAVLLLDDVLSELDSSRQNFLINAFGDVQLFITTTELTEEVKKALPQGKTFYVEKGTVSI